MTLSAHMDYETRSTVDLKKAGAYRYAEHSSTGVWCLSWRLGDGDVNRWHPGDEPPLDLIAHIEAGGEVIAQNAGFERVITNVVVRRDFPWWPELKIEQQDCTMARALALALPAGLDNLAIVLKLRSQKDKEGYNLMLRMCRPRSMSDDGTPIWWDEPDKIERLGQYCDVDVLTECDADAALPRLIPFEKQVWQLDQTINDRGVLLDVHTIERALEVVAEANKRSDDRMWYLTDGDVQKCTETAKIVAWLNKRGVPAVSIAKGEHEEIILSGQVLGDETVEEVIRLRGAAAKTSTKKFKAMLDCVCADGRARGLFGYSVASTRRWAGRLIQPHNLKRMDDDDGDNVDVPLAIALLQTPKAKADMLDSIELATGRPSLEVLSRCLRGMFIAGPGKKFYGADFSNIEGVVNAWLAGETWKVEGFRAAFAKMGPGMYETSYARSFGIDIAAVTKAMRQIGKVQELSLGYQGSVGAYVTMGANYGIKPAAVAAVARAATSDEAWAAVAKKYSVRDSRGLDRETWTGIKIVVNSWRAAHPAIVGSWWNLQEAALEAVQNPGAKIPVYDGKCAYLAANGFLFCQLPSKGVIAYAAPRIRETEWDPPVFYTIAGEETVKAMWSDDLQAMIHFTSENREIKPDEPLFLDDATEIPMKVRNKRNRKKYVVEYDGVDSKTKRWSPQYLYGGLQCENIVQATARDFLAEAMIRTEAAGYPIVLHVHDEEVSEVDEGFGSVDEYKQIMAQLPTWAEGCPIAVAAWEDKRYVK
jgi:DNA polymerase